MTTSRAIDQLRNHLKVPIVGDRVRVTDNSRNPEHRGRTGTVIALFYYVRLDGDESVVRKVPNSIELVNG